MIFYHSVLFIFFYFGYINAILLSDYYNFYLKKFVDGNDINLYDEIAFNFIEYFEKNIYNDSNCFKNLSVENVMNMLRYSDFDITFYRNNEIECINLNYTYYLFSYNFDSSPFIDNIKNQSFYFLKDSLYSTGICLPKECSNMVDLNFDENNYINKDSQIYNYLYNNFNISNVTKWNKVSKKENKKNESNTSIEEIIVMFIILYIIIKITIAIAGTYSLHIESQNLESMINEDEEKEKEKDKDKEKEKEKKIIKKEKDKSVFSKKHEINALSILNEDENKKKFWISLFNPIDNFNIYLNQPSALFNSSNMESFIIIRVIILFLSIYNYQFFIITRYHPTLSNNSFYDFKFFMIKLSTYAIILNYVLDGFIAFYKFMNYYKKQIIKHHKYIMFKFFLLCIPKIILFIINFYIFHSLFPSLLEYIGLKNDINEEFYLSYFNNFECQKEFPKMFIPIYYEYKNYYNISKCYSFVFIYKNEFVSFILSLILFSILFQIQNSIFDIIISIIIILNLLISPLLFVTSPTIYDKNSVFGNSSYISTPNIFFSCYMIGGLFGLMYFYYLDIISSNRFPFLYKPFDFVDYIVSKIDMLSHKVKVYLSLILFFILFLMSTNYNILRYFLGGDNIFFEMNLIAKIIYHYEIVFVIFIFLFLLIILLLFEQLRISLPFLNFVERINSTIFSNIDSFIQISFCFFDFHMELSYHDLFFLSIGHIFTIIILSGFINILFELPFKVLIKKIIKTK